MDDKMREYLGDQGRRYYNCLREFYNAPERMELLEYMMRYAEEEAIFLGVDDEKKLREVTRHRGYLIAKQIYEENIKRLNAGESESAPLHFLSDEQIHEELRQNYAGLEKKL